MLKLAAKLLVTCGALWLVFRTIDVTQVVATLHTAQLPWLAAAMFFLNLSQLISALRLRFYLAQQHLHLSRKYSVALYYVGMLFNLVLPGGIGGDGYQAYFLHRKKDFHWKTMVRVAISGRGNGLLLLVYYLLLLCFFSPLILALPLALPLLLIAVAVVFPVYSVIARKILQEPVCTQLRAMRYSALVQALGLVTMLCVLQAYGQGEHRVEYLALFLLSSIAAVLPVSIGGVGLRELAFFTGTQVLGLDVALGVALSVTYFLLSSLSALLGLVAFYRLR